MLAHIRLHAPFSLSQAKTIIQQQLDKIRVPASVSDDHCISLVFDEAKIGDEGVFDICDMLTENVKVSIDRMSCD